VLMKEPHNSGPKGETKTKENQSLRTLTGRLKGTEKKRPPWKKEGVHRVSFGKTDSEFKLTRWGQSLRPKPTEGGRTWGRRERRYQTRKKRGVAFRSKKAKGEKGMSGSNKETRGGVKGGPSLRRSPKNS